MSRGGLPVRLLAVLLLVVTALPGIAETVAASAVQQGQEPGSPAPPVSAAAAVVMDWRTGTVLYAKNADVRRDPASTTKVLTALIALERGNLSDQVRISRRAAYTPGSSMYLKPGEVYSLHDLLYGLLLRSGNDAAVAIAEHIAGSVEAFAELMNARARELGAQDSHFTNPHGLTQPDHYSTAYDLAIITREALRNPIFAEIVASRQVPLTYENQNREVVLYNTNRLLDILPGADGVKTGTTAAAGNCLIASATRDDHKLISVVLHAADRWADAARLLEWGFASYQMVYLARKGEVLIQAPVRRGMPGYVPLALDTDLAVLRPRRERGDLRIRLEVPRSLKAPVQKGQPVGRALAVLGNEVQAEAVLYTAGEARRRSVWEGIWQGIQSLWR